MENSLENVIKAPNMNLKPKWNLPHKSESLSLSFLDLSESENMGAGEGMSLLSHLLLGVEEEYQQFPAWS